MKPITHEAQLEIRQDRDGRRLVGTILQEGRPARRMLELFVRDAVTWPQEGIELLDKHFGKTLAVVLPQRDPSGKIRISTRATREIRQLYDSGSRSLSVEFHALRQNRLPSGIREVTRAVVDRVAMVPTGTEAYSQAQAEIRQDERRRPFWL